MRFGVPAAGRGVGQGHRHRGPDAAALPGLPLLHGGVPVSRALLQLVGSGVAGRHGEDAESRTCRRGCAASWRSATSATAACMPPRQGRRGRRRRDRPRRVRPACVEAAPPARSCSAIWPTSPATWRRRAQSAGGIPPAARGSARSRRSITGLEPAVGRDVAAKPPGAKEGPWLAPSYRPPLIARGVRPLLRRSSFCCWTAVGRAAGLRPVRRRAVSRLRPQPDQHGQPLRVRSLDLPGPDDHRARSGRVLHRLSALHPEAARN